MKNSRDRLVLNGVVTKAERGARFEVQCENGVIVNATPSGKIQKNLIKIIIGDKVTVEVSPYEPTKGRIITRTK